METGYYKVIAKLEYPAWNQKDGIEFIVYADSKRDAARSVRREPGYMDNCSGAGRVSLKTEYIGRRRS